MAIMTLTDLRYIVALARERHFGRAADRCNVAQPTLSVAVKKLEDQLGVTLFERGVGEVRVTAIGAPIVQQAEKVLAEAARVTELAAAGKDPLLGALRLGVIYTIGPYLLPALVPLMHERAPKMPLMLTEGYTDKLIERLKNGELDVLVLALPVAEPGIVAQAVYDEEFRVLVPAEHPWSRKKQVSTDDLMQEPLLMLGAGNCFRDQVLDLCSLASNESPRVLESSSLETIRHMVASGVGVTVMPASAVDGIARNDRLLKVKHFVSPSPTRRVGLVWRTTFPRHKAIDLLRQVLLDIALPGTQRSK
jgi:LysR family hydrogen peroxide-inducible transcriptional activator